MFGKSSRETESGIGAEKESAGASPTTDGSRQGRDRRRIRLVPALPLLVLALLIFAGITAPLLTPYDPVDNNLIESLQPPAWVVGGSSEHLLGTDSFGRDVLTRILYGARVSMVVVVFSLAIALVIGTTIGIVAGYFGGKIDSVLMRAVDVMKALPALLVAIVVAVVLGPSIRNVILILGLLIWPNIARLIRGEALLLKDLDFVAYARAVGISRWRVLSRHIFPNVLPTLLVAVTLQVANVITTEASLSFLGAGIPPPNPSWGVIIEDGRALISTGWWISLFSGLVVVITVLSFNSVGDWLRDRLDPQTRELI